jgi:phospholipase C
VASSLSRRRFLKAAVAGSAGLSLTSRAGGLIARAASYGTRCASLSDIEHVVIVVQENRSFDNYFGAYRGVAGFSDPNVLKQPSHLGQPVWYQYGWGPGDKAPLASHHLLPFHLDTKRTNAECSDDITHAWVAQHKSWNGGAMDRFVATHVSRDWDGVVAGPMTMGYYTRSDLGFYYAMADAFTICDHYHCSVMGPSTPNQLYYLSATIDPGGKAGGPVVDNPSSTIPGAPGTLAFVPGSGAPGLHWETMPEALEKAGVSWKFYQPPGSQALDFISNNSLLYFPKFRDPSSPLFEKGLLPSFPGDFQADVASGKLPHVSWVTSMSALDEHPPSPIPVGELFVIEQVLTTLLSNPAVWERTVVLLTYDENGGFFDHVPPPVAPPGTPREWITVQPAVGDAGGIKGPIGLGFRVPMLAISPFSVGGLVSSDVFDHTSTLRFIERRFGVPVPNLSAWRRSVTGDLTTAINFAAGARPVPPSFMRAVEGGVGSDAARVAQQCPVNATLDGAQMPVPYPIPANSLPSQERGTAPRPSGPVACRT